jgi:hypothetical protein
LGRRDSNLCISKSDLLNFIPPQRDLGVDRARLLLLPLDVFDFAHGRVVALPSKS